MRLVVVQSLLSPYRFPLFDVLSYVYDLNVWFMGKNVKNRKWDGSDLKYHVFKYDFLKGVTLNIGIHDNYPFWINMDIPLRLAKVNPDAVVIFGWDSLTSFLTVFLRFLYPKTKIILFSESTKYETSWRRSLTTPFVKALLRRVDYCLAAGSRAREYLELLDLSVKKIGIAPTTNDVDKYVYLTGKNKKQREELRNAMGYNEKDVVVMFYGQLIKRKGVDILVEAYSRLVQKNDSIKLLLIGDGKLLHSLRKKVTDLNLSGVTVFPNPGDHAICKYYALADVFVLPSRNDTWGLVVNEAMCAGLPVIVSDRVGSGSELVQDGQNGFVFKTEDVDDLVRVVKKLTEDAGLRRRFGKASSKIIQNFRPENTLKGYVDALGFVTKRSAGPTENNKLRFINSPEKGFLSVVIPVHNDSSGLTSTLQSLGLNRNGNTGLEVIVVNDGGDGDVSDVCRKFDVREIVVSLQSGSYNARNKGIEHSKGEKILFIDAGVVAGKDWVKKLSFDLDRFDYVCGPVNVTGGGFWLAKYEKNREFPVVELLNDLHFAPTANLGVRREVLDKIGGFDSRLESSGDYEFGNRVYFYADFSQHYDSGVEVFHPARSLFDMFAKQRRLARGFLSISDKHPDRFGGRGILIAASLIKFLLPPVWLVFKNSWRDLSLKAKIAVFLVTYMFSFYQHLYLLCYGLFVFKRRAPIHVL